MNVVPATFPTGVRGERPGSSAPPSHSGTQDDMLPHLMTLPFPPGTSRFTAAAGEYVGEGTPALSLLEARWPDWLLGPKLTTWEPGRSSPGTQKEREPALMRPKVFLAGFWVVH